MKMEKLKKVVALLLAASMIFPSVPIQAEGSEKILAEEQKEIRSIETVYDLIECIYKVTSSETGKSITYNGGLNVNAQTAENKEQQVQVIRYGDWNTADSLDNIPVAFQTGIDGKYFALEQDAAVNTEVTVREQISADRTLQFVLKKSSNWSEEHLAYKIYHPVSQMYVGYSAEEPYTLQACGKTAPDYDFVFTKTGDSVLGEVRTVPGYALLTEHEKERVFDLFGGIGAYSICYYGGDDVSQSFAQRSMMKLQEMYENLADMTDEEQAEKLRSIMQEPAFSGQTNWYGLPALPGAEEVKLEIQDETYGTYDFWRGTQLNGTKYTLVITDAYDSQVINFHVEDDRVAISNGNNAMEALKRIPYPLRKNIKNMFIRNDTANSYNCGGNDFYMRIAWVANKDTIAMYMTHEFGHSMDSIYNVNNSNSWQPARNSDIAGVSIYGNSNEWEDLADFGRLYFQCYGNINMMYGIRQMFPERYNTYVNVLCQTGYRDILAEKTEALEQGAYKTKLKDLVKKAETKAAKGSIYTEETMVALQTAIAQAQSIIANTKITQETVDEAYKNLDSALYELELAETKKKIAFFSFDDLTDGFAFDNAVAVNTGNALLSEDAKKGKALHLEGDGANYLKITKSDGTPLLSEYNELTVSFWSKVGAGSNWAFYAAPDDNQIPYLWENYMGILDSGTKVTAERYRNIGIRSDSAVVEASADKWRFITVVIRKDNTSIFVDGVRKAVADSDVLLSDILGDNSILYVGKANWGNGEYFNGLLDEFSIYNYPMTTAQVAALYNGTEPNETQAATAEKDQKKAEAVSALIKEIGTVIYSTNVKARIDEARSAYESLNAIQKELIAPEILKILEDAEQSYADAKDKFESLGKCRIAYFTFDDEQTGFESEYAKAVNKGMPVFTEDAKLGKALSLDGKNSNYLKVTDKDGKSLLTGYDEITICYWGKVEGTEGSNWSFFAAPNNRTAEYEFEEYAAILDKGNSLMVERYKNNGSRPAVNMAEAEENIWRFITVVISRDKTSVYVNAEKVSEEASDYLLSDILQDGSVCYIGRANWNVGEYFKGLMDEFSIYNYALTASQVSEAYQIYREGKNAYVVSFNSDGGTEVKSQRVIDGERVLEPEPPVKNGYNFGGWYYLNQKYDFANKVTQDITLTAKWIKRTEEKKPVSITSARIRLFKTTLTYTGKAQKPKVTVTYDGKKLTANIDYIVTYSNNKKVGQGTVKIAGKGKFNGKKILKYTIMPRTNKISKLTNKAGGKLIVKLKKSIKRTGAKGYEISYSTRRSFKGAKKVKTTKTSYKLKKLKTGKVYYVRVRSYAKIGKKIKYGAYSKVVKKKIDKS